jgi:hypothetical protein
MVKLMFVENIESLDQEQLFPCKSYYLMKFFVQHKKLSILSQKVDKKDDKMIWYFSKTQELEDALAEWAERKETGNYFFKKS